VYVRLIHTSVFLNVCWIQLVARQALCRSFLEPGATMVSSEAWQRQDPPPRCQDNIY
jgi:hypothetical protein